jgi:hypothetical protein
VGYHIPSSLGKALVELTGAIDTNINKIPELAWNITLSRQPAILREDDAVLFLNKCLKQSRLTVVADYFNL